MKRATSTSFCLRNKDNVAWQLVGIFLTLCGDRIGSAAKIFGDVNLEKNSLDVK